MQPNLHPHRPLWAPALLLLGLVACEPAGSNRPAPAPDPGVPVPLPEGLPADTVFLVEGEPITRAEIEEWVATFQLVEPGKSAQAIKTLVVTNLVLQRAICRVLAPEERKEALFRIEQAHAHLLAGGDPGESIDLRRIHNNWSSELGMDRWGRARETAQGEFSEVFEGPGYFTFVRRVASPDPEDWDPNTEATIEHVTEYYMEPEHMKEIVQGAMGQVKIQIVDPTWRRYLPTYYLHLASTEASTEQSELP